MSGVARSADRGGARWWRRGACRLAVLSLLVVTTSADAVQARVGSFERHDLVLGGEATASVVAGRAGGRRSVLALVQERRPASATDAGVARDGDGDGEVTTAAAPAERPEPFLVRVDLDPDGAPRAERLPVALRAGTRSLLAVDLDGDGIDELLLDAHAPAPEPPAIVRLRGWAAGEVPLLEPLAAATGRRLREAVVVPSSHGTLLCFGSLGSLDCLSSTPDGAIGSFGQYRLPFSVERERETLELSSPPVTALPVPVDGRIAAVGPRAVGTRRLRVDLLTADPAVQPVETWARLPAPERILGHRFLVVDGTPLLLVRTADAAKIDVFGKQRLRLFRLDSDRTRGGSAPLVAIETPYYAWAPVRVEVEDHDGDGHLDLVLVGRQGLTQGDVAVMVLHGLPGGRFGPARDVEVDGPGASFALGGDVDGDGRVDLVTLSRGELALRPGQASGSRPVASRPTARLALGEPAGRRVVTIGVGGDGASVEEARVAEDEGHGAADEGGEVEVEEGEVEDGDGDDGLAEDIAGAVDRELEVHDLDGDGRVEVLVWGEDDAASAGGDAVGADADAPKSPAGTVLRLLRWRA